MEIKLSDNQIKNLLIFLDRVEIKGLNEISAMTEILNQLQTGEAQKVTQVI